MDSEWVLNGLVIEGEHAMKRIDKDLDLQQIRRAISEIHDLHKI